MARPLSTSLPRVILKARRAKPFFGRHPWVFAGAIDRIEGTVADGDEVAVHSREGQWIARGLFNSQSNIRVRLYCWGEDRALDRAFWRGRITAALALRRDILHYDDPRGACRLVFSEADGLSGLVVDRYADYLVVQLTSLALAKRRDQLLDVLLEQLRPKGVYLRTERGIGRAEGLTLKDGPLFGTEPTELVVIREHALEYAVDLRQGQKTGFFLDHRENRAAVAAYLAGRRVVDPFCYTGSFAITAAGPGRAREVLASDVSEPAVALARDNARRNAASNVTFQVGDAFETLHRLQRESQRFDAVLLDPPRFARQRRAVTEALQAQLRLNRLAVDLLHPDGILVACSCSAHVARESFEAMLATVAQQSQRTIQILQPRGQAPDHPTSVSCLESNYLKCYICRVV